MCVCFASFSLLFLNSGFVLLKTTHAKLDIFLFCFSFHLLWFIFERSNVSSVFYYFKKWEMFHHVCFAAFSKSKSFPFAFCKKKSLTSLPVHRSPGTGHKVLSSCVLLYLFRKKSTMVVVVVDFCCCSALGNLWPVSSASRPSSRSLCPSLNPNPSCWSFRCRAAACKQCHTIWRRRGITAWHSCTRFPPQFLFPPAPVFRSFPT